MASKEERRLQKSRQEGKLTIDQHSKKLMATISKLSTGDVDAKMAFLQQAATLMPGGIPAFADIIKYPTIKSLVETYGNATMHKLVFLLVKDFCESINVVRNMTEDQMIECASMLINECGNFRLEDYVMFFASCKRGKYGRILDHIDINVISNMLDDYWMHRHQEGQAIQNKDVYMYEHMGDTKRIADSQDRQLSDRVTNIGAALSWMKDKLKNI